MKSRQPERRPGPELRILILNWRCPRNPRAGGAEAFTLEVVRRLVLRGHAVEWFSSSFPGAPAEESLDGVRIVRAGRQWTVHLAAFRRYKGMLARNFDLVVDEVNTIPFFTPLWSDVPTVMLIHQLAREVWWYESNFPLSAVGFVVEPRYLRLYRFVPVLTVSESTKADLLRLGFQGPITVVPEGLEPIAHLGVPKSSQPTFLYVGRIAPSKRIEHIVRAFALFRQATGVGTLWLVGSGLPRYQASLAKLAKKLGVDARVIFTGRVSSGEKHRLMAAAHAVLMTSVREGWGLTVSEAGACGTPSIVYNVPGLRDSVRNEVTGLVVPPRPEDLCGAMRRLIGDSALYSRLVAESKRWSQTLSFDESARLVLETLERTLASFEPRRRAVQPPSH